MTTFSINMTYDQLSAQLLAYSEREDVAYIEQVPSFINLAENRLATEMKQQGFQAVVDGAFELSVVQKKPAFWRETTSFGYYYGGQWRQLFLRSLEFCKAFAPNPTNVLLPKYYADYNINNFYLAGTPSARYQFELVYQARLDPLTASHQENWLTLNAPQALLYAALLEAALWRKNGEDIQMWKAEYGEAVGGLIAENKERLSDRGMTVDRG